MSVSGDVAGVFLAKKHSQLLALKEQIMRRIKSGDAGVDIGEYRVQFLKTDEALDLFGNVNLESL